MRSSSTAAQFSGVAVQYRAVVQHRATVRRGGLLRGGLLRRLGPTAHSPHEGPTAHSPHEGPTAHSPTPANHILVRHPTGTALSRTATRYSSASNRRAHLMSRKRPAKCPDAQGPRPTHRHLPIASCRDRHRAETGIVQGQASCRDRHLRHPAGTTLSRTATRYSSASNRRAHLLLHVPQATCQMLRCSGPTAHSPPPANHISVRHHRGHHRVGTRVWQA